MSRRREEGARSERLSNGGLEFDRRESAAAEGKKGDFNISKDFLIVVCDTLLTQLSSGH